MLPFSTKTSLKQIVEEIIVHINDLTKEIDLFKDKERDLTENFQYINQQYEQLNNRMLEEKNQKDSKKIYF